MPELSLPRGLVLSGAPGCGLVLRPRSAGVTQPQVEEGTRPLFVLHHLLLPVLLSRIQLGLPSAAPACPGWALAAGAT